jgi:TRAP-type C4-dicarboxylate transport system permease small subunit
MIQTFSKYFDGFIQKILLLSLAGMLSLSSLSIILRWLGTSLLWIDPLVRHLVLVGAFSGGCLAVAKKNHIRIDLAAKILEKAPHLLQSTVERLLMLASALISLALMLSAWNFFQMESEFGSESFLGIHSSLWVGILPAGWMLLSFRWLLALVTPSSKER